MTSRPIDSRHAAPRLARRAPRARRLLAALALALVAAPAVAGAQGSLSLQGFGYPTGQLSTRALATGGALGEFDPASPINPAAAALWGRLGLAFQYEPEFRTTEVGELSQTIKLPRFPLISLGVPVRRRAAIGLSASTLLDRTFDTRYNTTETIDGEEVPAIATYDSRGSITDVRLAAGYWVTRYLRVGAAGHLLVGENRVNSGRTFPRDSLRYRTILDTVSIGFSGTAFSVGLDWQPIRGVGVAGSWRRGGALRTISDDTTLTRASAPDRIGVGLLFDRVPGATFAASYALTKWTRMEGLSSRDVSVSDAPEFSIGADVAGPRIGANAILFRAGYRDRTLPFGVGDSEVKERAFTGGLGAPLGGGRAMLDFTTQYAQRDFTNPGEALASVAEHAWTFSFGITLRP